MSVFYAIAMTTNGFYSENYVSLKPRKCILFLSNKPSCFNAGCMIFKQICVYSYKTFDPQLLASAKRLTFRFETYSN